VRRAASLDHVGVVGRNLDVLAEAFEAVGFRLTPFARHAGGRTGNRCAMLRGSYIELMAILPGGTSATLERFLGRHAGAHILGFGIADEVAALARLRRALPSVPDPVATERLADEADPEGPRARFLTLIPPDRPEGRYVLVRHLTPDALWQNRYLQHPNRAETLAEAIIVAPEPAGVAAALSCLAGWPVVPDPSGGYALPLPVGCVRVLPEGEPLGLPHTPEAPCIAALTIITQDKNQALRRLLGDHGIPHVNRGDAVLVEAGGVALRFVG
jgi:hypothetical protein